MRVFLYLLQVLMTFSGASSPKAGGSWDPLENASPDATGMWDPNG